MKLRPVLAARRRLAWRRPGAATVELAILTPLLAFLFVITLDFGRIFYYTTTLDNCARNGALAGTNTANAQMPYASIAAATVADGASLSPPLTSSNVTVSYTYDVNNKATTITVQVNYSFTTFIAYPALPGTVNVMRQVEMAIAPP